MKHNFYRFFFSFLLMILCWSTTLLPCERIQASNDFVLLSNYSKTMSIGDESRLIAIPMNGKKPSFKSSSSKIASVDSFGLITAKKAGTCRITVKASKAQAICQITVLPTTITLNHTSYSMENAHSIQLTAKTSNGHPVKWKSSRRSIVTVDESGKITSKKPGEADITASVDGSSAKCHVTVLSPKIKLSSTALVLYRTQTFRLEASVSSKKAVKWKTNKKSVATVDAKGKITAVKHGKATITATVDGVSKSCTVTVAQPVIRLSKSEVTLSVGSKYQLTADVSSGVSPTWKSSNINRVTVDSKGMITAREKGKAYIYASEDGIKVSCKIIIRDPSK